MYVSLLQLCAWAWYKTPTKSRKKVEDGEEEDSVLPGLVLFPTQVEAKGSDLTCHVSTHHATHHQIVTLYWIIQLFIILLLYCWMGGRGKWGGGGRRGGGWLDFQVKFCFQHTGGKRPKTVKNQSPPPTTLAKQKIPQASKQGRGHVYAFILSLRQSPLYRQWDHNVTQELSPLKRNTRHQITAEKS